MNNLCAIRDVCRALSEFENKFQQRHSLCMNEGMVLCCLKSGSLSSGEIAEMMNLTCSNTSKVIRSVEDKGLIERVLGEKDRRQMYFILTDEGRRKLEEIDNEQIEIPELLQPIVN